MTSLKSPQGFVGIETAFEFLNGIEMNWGWLVRGNFVGIQKFSSVRTTKELFYELINSNKINLKCLKDRQKLKKPSNLVKILR